jgi:transposase
VLRSEQMNAGVSIQHLEQFLARYPDRPLVLFWDRATWHKGKRVQQFLEAHPRLEIVYFPVGTPELNPQEHVWKATRHAVSHNQRVDNGNAIRSLLNYFTTPDWDQTEKCFDELAADFIHLW